MIEKVTVNNIRCDVCHCHLENSTSDGMRVFQKDICSTCVEQIFKKLEKDRILSQAAFDDIVDDIVHKI